MKRCLSGYNSCYSYSTVAGAFEEDRKIALEAGMNGHLAKPYNIPAIMETLKTLIG